MLPGSCLHRPPSDRGVATRACPRGRRHGPEQGTAQRRRSQDQTLQPCCCGPRPSSRARATQIVERARAQPIRAHDRRPARGVGEPGVLAARACGMGLAHQGLTQSEVRIGLGHCQGRPAGTSGASAIDSGAGRRDCRPPLPARAIGNAPAQSCAMYAPPAVTPRVDMHGLAARAGWSTNGRSPSSPATWVHGLPVAGAPARTSP